MLMFLARRMEWLSLGALAMTAAAVITVMLIASPVRSAPILGAVFAFTGIGKAAPGDDASSEAQTNRASRPKVSEEISDRAALILYILMEASRPSR